MNIRLYRYADLYRTAPQIAFGYDLVVALDAICASKTMVWKNGGIFSYVKSDQEAIIELWVSSSVLMTRAVWGTFVNILPIKEAGYECEYTFVNDALVALVWTTPKGNITLEYNHAGNKPSQDTGRGSKHIGRGKTGL